MLNRKFYDTLLQWKSEKKEECLVVKGARQVGKTFIVEKFGKENYSSYIYINFLKKPEYREIFSNSLEPEDIYKNISLYLSDVSFVAGDTLLFLDEIQACKKAYTALKFLALDHTCDVIASGSLLGLNYNPWEDDAESSEEYSVPVGYENEVEMYALDFEEFLWANGVTADAVHILKEYFSNCEKLDDALNQRYMRLLREYMVVGGMPEVVQAYVDGRNFQVAWNLQQRILNDYQRDIGHYAKNSDKPKIQKCYQSIPRQLARESKKFSYGVVENGGKARKYGNAINWLLDAGMVKKITNVAMPTMPLVAYEKEEEFKLYVSDIGLLTAMYGTETQRALMENALKGPAKGGIYENLIFDILQKRGVKLFYYHRIHSEQEIEFLIEKEGEVIPIEVKSKNGETKSLNGFMEEFAPSYAYKLIDGNIGVSENGRITLPLYMAIYL